MFVVFHSRLGPEKANALLALADKSAVDSRDRFLFDGPLESIIRSSDFSSRSS
jgi:hypothetical protein